MDGVVLEYASELEKVASVMYCVASSPHTIRTARHCATTYVFVGEKVVSRILKALERVGAVVFDTRIRRWVWVHPQRPSSIIEARRLAKALGLVRP